MAVGIQPDAASLNAQLANNAIGLRATADSIRRLWAYVGPLGAERLEGEPWNMDPDDAADYYGKLSHLQAVAAIYFGTGAQAQPFDYDAELAPVRGGA